MVVATKTIEREEAVQAPLTFDWPVRTRPRPNIEAWPVREPSLEERARALHQDWQPFRDWLLARPRVIVGRSFDGRACPFSNFLMSELGALAPGGVYTSVGQTGLHQCQYRRCEQHAHIEHPGWLTRFIQRIDTGSRGRGVRGATALKALDAAIAHTARLEKLRAGA
jgi:hypothetical protein